MIKSIINNVKLNLCAVIMLLSLICLNINSAARITTESAGTNHKLINDELIEAAFLGNIDKVRKLIESGIDVNSVGTLKNRPANKAIWDATALIAASAQGNIEIVRYLIESKADMEKIDALKDTALVKAIRYDHNDVVQLLLDNGADITYNKDYEAKIEKTHLSKNENRTILFLDDNKNEGCSILWLEVEQRSNIPFGKPKLLGEMLLVSFNYCDINNESIKKSLLNHEDNFLVRVLINRDSKDFCKKQNIVFSLTGTGSGSPLKHQVKMDYIVLNCSIGRIKDDKQVVKKNDIKITEIMKLIENEPKRREIAQRFRKEKIIETLMQKTPMPTSLILLIDTYLPESTIKESLHDYIVSELAK